MYTHIHAVCVFEKHAVCVCTIFEYLSAFSVCVTACDCACALCVCMCVWCIFRVRVCVYDQMLGNSLRKQ